MLLLCYYYFDFASIVAGVVAVEECNVVGWYWVEVDGEQYEGLDGCDKVVA